MFERPWCSGKFLITAGLRPLEGRPVFQEEPDLGKYLNNKRDARAESLIKHYPLPIGLSEDELALAGQFLKDKLKEDLPSHVLDGSFEARDPVDFVISQVPEDFAVWKMKDNKEWLALIHLSSPNHWSAGDKIGKSFSESHAPIPHIGALSKAAPKIFEQIERRGPVERFAWGVATDDRLNHHPEPPPHTPEKEWRGRSFDISSPRLYIRLERQTLFPMNSELIGFTIKTNFIDITGLPKNEIPPLAQSLAEMDEELLKYKGLSKSLTDVLSWLNALS